MKRSLTSLLPLLLWGTFFTSTFTQNITGDWHGLLDIQGYSLRIKLNVQLDSGRYIVNMYSIDQTPDPFHVPEFSFENGIVEFAIPAFTINYTGTVDPEFSAIKGTFRQGGQSFLLNFTRKIVEAPPGSPDWVRERMTKREVYIPMRDGVRLFTSIYTPKDTSRTYPILITRTPYNIEPGGEDVYSAANAQLVEEGYIIVYQDVRGRFMSEGTFQDVRPYNPRKKNKNDIDESSDTYDAIDWLVKNVPYNNGRVGMYGISYPGFYSTMSLLDAHPALRAVSPQAPVGNWFIGDDWHHNGAFFLADAFNFYSVIGQPRPKPTRQWPQGFQWPNQDNYEFFLELGAIRNAKERYFGDSIQFWNELMNHPNYDDFWKARNPLPHLKNIKPAVLTVGGWFDAEDCWGALHTYEAIEKQNSPSLHNYLLVGPWFHGQWSGSEATKLGNVHWGQNTAEQYARMELQFFNYFLKDKGALDFPEASIFITGANEWRRFDTWPPKNVVEKSLYFQPRGGLSFNAPTVTNANDGQAFDEYVADPMNPVPYTEDVHLRRTVTYMTDDQRFADRRPDVVSYETAVLEKDVTLTGPITADLWVSTTGSDADYVVKLIDVFPDTLKNYPANDKQVPMAGYQMLVRGEIMRGRYRNSFENPAPFVPNEITQVKFELPAVAHTFKKGHRIMVQVQNSWFPLADRNPQQFVDIYHCSDSEFKKAIHRIYHQPDKPSSVKILVLDQ